MTGARRNNGREPVVPPFFVYMGPGLVCGKGSCKVCCAYWIGGEAVSVAGCQTVRLTFLPRLWEVARCSSVLASRTCCRASASWRLAAAARCDACCSAARAFWSRCSALASWARAFSAFFLACCSWVCAARTFCSAFCRPALLCGMGRVACDDPVVAAMGAMVPPYPLDI